MVEVNKLWVFSAAVNIGINEWRENKIQLLLTSGKILSVIAASLGHSGASYTSTPKRSHASY